ncbi:unnamed protein product [Lota lota]
MGRKKTTMGRKKTTMGRKKTTMGWKKTTMGEGDQLAQESDRAHLLGQRSWGVPLSVEVFWDPQKRRTSSHKSPTELTYWGKGPDGRGGPARTRVRQSSPTGAKVLGGPVECGGLVGPPGEGDQLAQESDRAHLLGQRSWGVPLSVEVLWDLQERGTSSHKSPTELTYWGKGPGGSR